MSTEKGQNVLLYVGDGGEAELTAATISIMGETSIVGGRVNRTSGSYITDGFVAGQVVHVSGHVVNGTFHGIIKNVAALSLLIDEVIDDDGNPKTLVDEAAGASVTVTGESFNLFKGQDETNMDIAMGEIDASTKDTGKWGASLSGTARMTVSANGKVNWPATNDVYAIEQSLNDENEEVVRWLKLILNAAGDYWFGLFSVTGCNITGPKDGTTNYSVTFANKIRPRRVAVA